MPQNVDIYVGDTPVLLTNSDVTGLRIQNLGQYRVKLMSTVGATPPVSWEGAIEVFPGMVILPDMLLENLFPGVNGGNRVYAIATSEVKLAVSHA